MTEQDARPFLKAVKTHISLWAAVLLCIMFALHVAAMSVLLARIEQVRCHCSTMRLQGGNNTNSVHFEKPWTREETIREIAGQITESQIADNQLKTKGPSK